MHLFIPEIETSKYLSFLTENLRFVVIYEIKHLFFFFFKGR